MLILTGKSPGNGRQRLPLVLGWGWGGEVPALVQLTQQSSKVPSPSGGSDDSGPDRLAKAVTAGEMVVWKSWRAVGLKQKSNADRG